MGTVAEDQAFEVVVVPSGDRDGARRCFPGSEGVPLGDVVDGRGENVGEFGVRVDFK